MITKSDDREAGVRFVNHVYEYRPNRYNLQGLLDAIWLFEFRSICDRQSYTTVQLRASVQVMIYPGGLSTKQIRGDGKKRAGIVFRHSKIDVSTKERNCRVSLPAHVYSRVLSEKFDSSSLGLKSWARLQAS